MAFPLKPGVHYLIDGPVLGVWVADIGLAVWVLIGVAWGLMEAGPADGSIDGEACAGRLAVAGICGKPGCTSAP